MTTEYHVADARVWMQGKRHLGAVCTGIADAAEIGATLEQWLDWCRECLGLAMALATPGCPVVMCLTDRKADGQTYSKAEMVFAAGRACGYKLLWHKIAIRKGVGKTDLHRPGYTHMIAMGDATCKPGSATPDVIEHGRLIYPNALGLTAAKLCVSYCLQSSKVVVDPFCGRGTIPAMVSALGGHGIGVDILQSQIALAKQLVIRRGRS
jgi:hypothetical protein